MRSELRSVSVISLKQVLPPEFTNPSGGREMFNANLDATYIKQYPAGSGQLPSYYVVVPDPSNPGHWLMDEEDTGP